MTAAERRPRRIESVLIVASGLVLAGTLALLLRDPRSWTAWLVAAGAFGNLMTGVILRRSRARG